MALPYLGEIRMFAGNFAPSGWAFCDGSLLSISANDALFNLIGTTYGGDGQTTFALPDLRGRLPLHQGNSFILAETGGVEQVTLTVSQIPSHTHPLLVNTSGGSSNAAQGNTLAASPTLDLYRQSPPTVALSPAAVGSTGGSQPHNNFQPYLCVNFIIATAPPPDGSIFPSPT